MTSIKDACRKVAAELGGIKITKILDAGDFWVFFDELMVGPDPVIGHHPFAVNKSDGALWVFPPPPYLTDKQRTAFETAKTISIPDF